MRFRSLLLILVMVPILSGCDILSELVSFTKCEFRLKSMTDTELAGVNIQELSSFKSLNLLDAGRITASLFTGELPLSFRLNVEIKNPNTTTAALNQTDWILLIDGIEMTRGINNDRVEIGANGGKAVLPLDLKFDLKKVLSNESKDALLGFAFNLADPSGAPTRVTLKVKPTVMVGPSPLAYPGYITVNQEFGAN